MRTFKLLLIVLFSMGTLNIMAQKQPVLFNDEEIISKAQSSLEQSLESGVLKQKAAELGIKGQFILDITIHKKGNVLTVYSPFEIADEKIPSQNRLKDLLMAYQFPFKLAKNKRVKFRQTFNFS